MKIRVDDIREDEKEVAFDEDPAPVNEALSLSKAPDYRFRGPTKVSLSYYRAGEDLFFQGKLAGEASATCARCAETFPYPLRKDFSLVMKPKPAPGGDADPDQSLAFYEGDEVDLSPLVRDELLISLPSRALCKEDCAGLCPRCGANRNWTPCECTEERPDARLDVLKRWKPKTQAET